MAYSSPTPERRWTVTLADNRIEAAGPDGTIQHLLWDDLRAVVIETNDSGPWGADFWWLLFGADDTIAVGFPQGANGEPAAMDRLMSLPGFDHEAMIRATASTAEAVFPVWRRSPA